MRRVPDRPLVQRVKNSDASPTTLPTSDIALGGLRRAFGIALFTAVFSTIPCGDHRQYVGLGFPSTKSCKHYIIQICIHIYKSIIYTVYIYIYA